MQPDTVGLAALAGEIAILGLAASSLGIPVWGWVIAYVALAIGALFMWHGEKWPKQAGKVLQLVVGNLLLGGFFFGIDLVLGHFLHPELSTLEAAMRSGGPFGIALTVLVCRLVTTIVLAGYFRAIFLEYKGDAYLR